MGKIKIRYIDPEKKEHFLECEGKNTVSYYNRYFSMHRVVCSKCIAESKLRMLKWADKHDLVPSNYPFYYGEKGQRRILQHRSISWFDHTTYWRKKHKNRTLFCLTEPYQAAFLSDQESDHIEIGGMNIKIIDPSDKNLWNPSSTYMIFIFEEENQKEVNQVSEEFF